MFCEFVSDEAYANSFESEIFNNMRRSCICSHCIGHKSVVGRIHEYIIHKLFCRVSSSNNEVML